MPQPGTLISGTCDPRFAAVRTVFADHFARGLEIGARFSLVAEGEVVVDLWAGLADRRTAAPFGPDTLVPVFSTTKAVAAIMIARLVDQGSVSFDQTVASIWPAFGQAGKDQITLGQLMSHQSGLAAIPEAFDPERWFDRQATCAALAAQAPLWAPGSASGYHPLTIGYLVGEIFQRIDGRSLGTALREDITEPAGLDIWIGLPASEHERVASMTRPAGPADFGEVTPLRAAAFLKPWSSVAGRESTRWRELEVPSANGHATALALARLMSALATDGRVDDVQVLSPPVIREASAEWISGPDLVLPFDVSWGAGFFRNPPGMIYGPSPAAFGHSGWGGACAFADPEARLAGAYVPTRQSVHLIGDPRARGLIEAAYSCL